MKKFSKIAFLILQTFELGIIILLLVRIMKNPLPNYSNMIEKTVEVRIVDANGNEGFATGAKIKQGIITNKHVVYSSNKFYNTIEIRESNAQDYIPIAIDKIKIDENSDLALLEYESSNYFQLNTNFSIGDKCFAIGNPNGNGLGISFGNISTINYIDAFCKDAVIRVDMTLNKGNSGGPLLNENGQIIGLISFRLKDNNGDILSGLVYAIKTTTIENFIKNI